MSIKAMQFVWDNAAQAESKLLMLLALADYADEDGGCYASVATLAKKIRQSESNARRILHYLETQHAIAIVHRGGIETGNGKTNRYYLVMPGVNCKDYDDLCRKVGATPVAKVEPKPKPGGKREKPEEVAALPEVAHVLGVAALLGQEVAALLGNPLVEPSEEPLVESAGSSPLPDEATSRPNHFLVFEQNISLLTPMLADQLKNLASDYGEVWLEMAIRTAALNSKRSLSYVMGILRRWRADGYNPPSELLAATPEPAMPQKRLIADTDCPHCKGKGSYLEQSFVDGIEYWDTKLCGCLREIAVGVA